MTKKPIPDFETIRDQLVGGASTAVENLRDQLAGASTAVATLRDQLAGVSTAVANFVPPRTISVEHAFRPCQRGQCRRLCREHDALDGLVADHPWFARGLFCSVG
jgi:hypothetical protein